VNGVQFYSGNEHSGIVLVTFCFLGVLGVFNMFAEGLKVRRKMLQNDCVILACYSNECTILRQDLYCYSVETFGTIYQLEFIELAHLND
jgi:hypothetical protein